MSVLSTSTDILTKTFNYEKMNPYGFGDKGKVYFINILMYPILVLIRV